jgi:UDP-3-O-[3-hydroxymyristoyl] glucosamine N-acyltransferase
VAKEVDVMDVASIVKGRVLGNSPGNGKVTGTCAIDNYIPNKVSFVKNEKYSKVLGTLKGAVVLINEDQAKLYEAYPQNVYITVKDVVNSMVDLQEFFYKDELSFTEVGISETARIDRTATIGKGVFIGDNVFVGRKVTIGDGTKIMTNSVLMENVKIGDRTVIDPGVTIYRNCQIGDDVLLRSGVCIGNDGFRFVQNSSDSTIRKMIQTGNVVIGNRVEVGCNAVICRGSYEGNATTISDDCKIGDLVNIAHSVTIGARTVLIGTCAIAGSTRIGEDVYIGPGATISNDLTIGNRAKILINAIVAYDVADDQMVSGFYAMPHKQWKKAFQMLKDYGIESQ